MQVFVIFDTERYYTEKLVRMLTARRTLPYDFHAFTDPDKLHQFLTRSRTDILLVSEKDFDESLLDECRGKVVLLGEEDALPFKGDIPRVYKYQPSGSLMQDVLAAVRTEEIVSGRSSVLRGRQKIIAVYSPLGRCHKTMFSLALGEHLAEDHTVLYLNFEPYPALLQLSLPPKGLTLSDIIYDLQEGGEQTVLQIEKAAVPYGHMFCVPPVRVPEDIFDLTGTDMDRLFTQLHSRSRFERIILDLGNSIRDIPEILSGCDMVYMPVLPDPVSRAKTDAFISHMIDDDQEQTLARIREVQLPPLQPSETFGDQILSSVLSGIGAAAAERIRKDEL